MRIILAGCGKVGETIVKHLIDEVTDITVIDEDAQVVSDIANTYDVMGFVGNAASYSVLREAGIEGADLLIAVTNADELNLLCCLIAKKAGVKNTIARVRNPIYSSEISFIQEELGLSLTVNPEYAAATEAARILRFPLAIDIDTFAGGRVELLKFHIPESSRLDELVLSDIHKIQSGVLVCTVERDGQAFIPGGNFVLKSGDTISIAAAPADAKEFFEKIGMQSHRVKDALIVGGGKIAFYLAQQLLRAGIAVKIIEKDRKRCEELSDLLPRATIICGDATEESVLTEEGIDTCEAFVTLTGIDEANIFLSLYAMDCSKAKVITKINRITFEEILGHFNLGSVIHPKYITAEYILSYVRAMQNTIGSNVSTMYNIIEGKAEALEFDIHRDAPVIGRPIMELNMKKGVLVASIIRGSETIIPNGRSQIEVGDKVIIVTTDKGFRDITDILAT